MQEYEIRHINAVRKIAPECMVLLKSDGSFPLDKPGKIALYGCGARRTLKGGSGSGDVNVRAFTTVEQGLENAGFVITTKYWLDAYEKAWLDGRVGFRAWLKEKIAAEGMDTLMENLSIVMPEPDYDIPLVGEGDTAIYVLSRLCGEGVDRQDVPGDFRLSRTEIRDILQLEKQYDKFMLVLNTACVVDLSPVAESVSNILLLSQPGMTVGDSLADVLLGREYPSGKLAVTWACGDDYDYISEFGNRDDTRYTEGIYVGYRYFDSVGKRPIFPFGFGLGYTKFSISCENPILRGTEVCVPVKVKNIGSYPGKEVVQLYVSIPEGKLDQPYQTLAAFVKTPELKPGEECKLEVSFKMETLASYDSESCSRILEGGEYILRIGNCSRDTMIAGIVEIDSEVTIERVTPVGGDTDFDDWKPEKEEVSASREMISANSDSQVTCNTCKGKSVVRLHLSSKDFKPFAHHAPTIDPEALSLVRKLPDEELAYLCTGDFVGEGSQDVIGGSAITVAGAAGETTGRFKAYGVENLIMADGPAGLRLSRLYGTDENGVYVIEPEKEEEVEDKMQLLPEAIVKALLAMFPKTFDKVERTGEIREQNCTAIPVAAAIAQSWNTALAECCGLIVADEMKRCGIDIWLAPAMNIQRHPLCGRNFEYFSEDPLISGKMAPAITRGVQNEPGRCVTIKHFICNNQETNRFRTSSMVNERALRDIYARGFEIAVKEGKPLALMTSYNLLNGVHTCERYGLIETMLRKEWGFDGIVMSDFLGVEESESDRTNKYPKFNSVRSIKAGLDLLMPGGKGHYSNLLNALRGKSAKDTLSRDEIEKCAARMVAFAWRLKGKRIKH